MSPSLGTLVTTSEAPSPSGVPTNTATGFMIGRADQGTASAYQLITNITSFANTYGARTTTNSLFYDSADVFFRTGGSQLYAGRVVGSGATAATLTLNDAGVHPTLVVTANSVGSNGNGYYIVVSTVGAQFSLTVQDVNANVLVTSPLFSTTAAAITWSLTAPFITVTQSSASGFTTNNPTTMAATALTGGSDAWTLVPEVDVLGLGSASAGSVICTFTWNGQQYTTAAIAFNATLVATVAAFNAATPVPASGTPLPATAFTGAGGPLPGAVTLTATAALPGSLAPITVTPTGLTGGTATFTRSTPGTGMTLTSWQTALALFPGTLGPGQVSAPGQTDTTLNGIVSSLFFHAYTYNRFAVADVDSNTMATNIASTATVRASYTAGWGAFFGPACNVPGTTPGTLRTVPASAVMSGLVGKVDQRGNPNIAAAGRSYPLPYVVSLAWPTVMGGMQDTDANILLGNLAGVNSFELRYGVLEPFGFSAAVPPTVDPIYWQASHGRLRMALYADAQSVGEPFLFSQIDGQGVTITKFGAAISSMLNGYWLAGALYGATPADAYSVNVGPSVNTPTTIANGELHALAQVRLSPFAQFVELDLVAVPTTQALT